MIGGPDWAVVTKLSPDPRKAGSGIRSSFRQNWHGGSMDLCDDSVALLAI